MQDNWCGEEMPMAGSSHNHWGQEEEEEVEIGMWNNSTYTRQKMPPKVNHTSSQVDFIGQNLWIQG